MIFWLVDDFHNYMWMRDVESAPPSEAREIKTGVGSLYVEMDCFLLTGYISVQRFVRIHHSL